jgi:UDP-glucuronate 4-epimerase
MTVLVTGCAGFIGLFAARALLERGDAVVGLDNLNGYYDVELKRARLALLLAYPQFRFVEGDCADTGCVDQVFDGHACRKVVHLAAQAGVRYSLKNPLAYVHSNLLGFANILEACRRTAIEHLVYASTSSVYGGNRKLPFEESDPVDHPVSFYAATKKANELMAHSYSHLYSLPTTGLRFFTVYGPWGRPDMSPILFAHAIMQGKPIEVFNHGDMARDFTYVDDIVKGLVGLLDQPAQPDPDFDATAPDPATSSAPYRIYNIGNHQAVNLMDYITTLETVLGRTTEKIMRPMQPGDVPDTYAATGRIQAAVGFAPTTPLQAGLRQFAEWFTQYYGYAKLAAPQ